MPADRTDAPSADVSPLPERVDVVVIGGGIVGVSAALTLAERGVSVALCEKGEVGAEQSGRNWGWCRKMGRDPAEIPLAVESLRLWEGMNARVGAETGFRSSGVVYLAADRAGLAPYEGWMEQARARQLDSRMLGPDEVAALLPGSARRWAGAFHTPSDGRAEPSLATPAMAAAARRAGAAILTNCAARGLERTAGRVSAVVTERGTIRCDAAVLAGGAWSRLFCGNLGVDFPQLKVLGSVFRTQPLDGLPDTAVGAGNFAFRRRLDGGYTVAQRGANVSPLVPDSLRLFRDFLPSYRRSWRELRLRLGRSFLQEWRVKRRWSLDEATPFETVRVLDPAPVPSILAEARRNLSAAFPGFANMRVAGEWGGLIDVTPDAVPVISPVAAVPGFFLASGFSGHGFGIGPASGQLVADLVTGARPTVDPAPFRFERLRPAAARH